jgi:hypothetical protein
MCTAASVQSYHLTPRRDLISRPMVPVSLVAGGDAAKVDIFPDFAGIFYVSALSRHPRPGHQLLQPEEPSGWLRAVQNSRIHGRDVDRCLHHVRQAGLRSILVATRIQVLFFSSSSSSPFSNCSFLFTALLTRMGWSHLRDTQGFGMQCVSYIRHIVASRQGIVARSRASCQPFSRLPSESKFYTGNQEQIQHQ